MLLFLCTFPVFGVGEKIIKTNIYRCPCLHYKQLFFKHVSFLSIPDFHLLNVSFGFKYTFCTGIGRMYIFCHLNIIWKLFLLLLTGLQIIRGLPELQNVTKHYKLNHIWSVRFMSEDDAKSKWRLNHFNILLCSDLTFDTFFVLLNKNKLF